MITINDREQAVLDVLREANKPMKHGAICQAIKAPWYDKQSSFSASVSSTLGWLRSKGLIAPLEVRRQRPIYTAHGLVTPTDRSWFVTPAGMGFTGWIVSEKKPRIVGNQGQHGLMSYQAKAIKRVVPGSVIVRSMQRLPHTDDMKQMLDDLGIKPPIDYAEYAKRIQVEIAKAMGIPYEHIARIW